VCYPEPGPTKLDALKPPPLMEEFDAFGHAFNSQWSFAKSQHAVAQMDTNGNGTVGGGARWEGQGSEAWSGCWERACSTLSGMGVVVWCMVMRLSLCGGGAGGVRGLLPPVPQAPHQRSVSSRRREDAGRRQQSAAQPPRSWSAWGSQTPVAPHIVPNGCQCAAEAAGATPLIDEVPLGKYE
jgi:hypothetical protein